MGAGGKRTAPCVVQRRDERANPERKKKMHLSQGKSCVSPEQPAEEDVVSSLPRLQGAGG